jgi:aldose 1-epimerase
MILTAAPFGKTKSGIQVTQYTMRGDSGLSVSVLDYGAAVRSLIVPAGDRRVDVVLGYDTAAEYEENGGFMGAVVGRVSNRIGNGRFRLNGKIYQLGINDGANHLHGGTEGFYRRVWRAAPRADSLSFLYLSPDGEEGYPGNLACSATYAIRGNALEISYSALCDADTLCCMSSHCYFNLAGRGDILGHELSIDAGGYCPTDAAGLADGRVLPAAGTPFDFGSGKKIGADIGADDEQLTFGRGYDHNFALNGAGFRRAARLSCAESGLCMEVLTDMPGLQLYTGNSLTPRRGKGGAEYAPRSGVCLEAQFFPDAVNHPDFASPLLRAGVRYSSRTEYRFGAL